MWNLLDIPDQTPEENYRNAEGWMSIFQEIQAVLANDFIFGGILHRFPKLKLVCSEFEISWIPGFMSRLDQMETLLPRLKLPRLEMRASAYMRTRVWHGFIEDTAAAHVIPYIGVARILWGSDFPHIRSIGLDTQSALKESIGNLPRADQEKLVGGNAARVFNLNRNLSQSFGLHCIQFCAGISQIEFSLRQRFDETVPCPEELGRRAVTSGLQFPRIIKTT